MQHEDGVDGIGGERQLAGSATLSDGKIFPDGNMLYYGGVDLLGGCREPLGIVEDSQNPTR